MNKAANTSPSDSVRNGKYGFLFWLGWISWFAGSFVLASVLWTAVIGLLFGRIQGEELTVTWAISVFGSWLLLVIPFMRKKERIWKRLNQDEERAASAWFGAMGLFVGLLIGSALFWSLFYRRAIVQPGVYTPWARGVIVTSLISLVPILIWMYRKADILFKEAAERQFYKPMYSISRVPIEERLLPAELARKLQGIPPTLKNGHLVRVIPNGGRRDCLLFILNRKEIAGIYGVSWVDLDVNGIQEFIPIDPNSLPNLQEKSWTKFVC